MSYSKYDAPRPKNAGDALIAGFVIALVVMGFKYFADRSRYENYTSWKNNLRSTELKVKSFTETQPLVYKVDAVLKNGVEKILIFNIAVQPSFTDKDRIKETYNVLDGASKEPVNIYCWEGFLYDQDVIYTCWNNQHAQ